MSEQELREGLLLAVAGEPALTFDPDALMDRARREINRRRALVGAGTATVVVAVAVPAMLGVPKVGNPAGGGGSGPGGCPSVSVPEPSDPSEFPIPSAPPGVSFKVKISAPPTVSEVPRTTPVPPSEPAYPCASTPSEPPSSPVPPTFSGSPSANPPAADFPWPPPDVTKKHYTAEQLKARGTEMRRYLRDYFAKTVPGATDVNAQEFAGEAAGDVKDGQVYLNSFVGFTLKGMRSAVGVAVYSPGEGPSPAKMCAEGVCSVRQLRAGDHLVVTKVNGGEIVLVAHYRTDGAVVVVSGYRYDPTANTDSQLPEVPVSGDQLTKLATDPALGI